MEKEEVKLEGSILYDIIQYIENSKISTKTIRTNKWIQQSFVI